MHKDNDKHIKTFELLLLAYSVGNKTLKINVDIKT